MVTRLMLLAAVMMFLSGCSTYQTRHVYDDGYYADDVAYVDRDGSRYAPARDGYGDYYVGRRDYHYADSYYYPTYLQWPAYHSLFWGFNRWYHDPFYYPGYYYGVTYYPRNYLSFTARRGLFMFDVGHRYFPYSPYRHAWHDTYYDWSYWHHNYPSHRQYHREPRFGSARNEAERLAWRDRTSNASSLRQAASSSTRLNDRGRADYGSGPRARDESRARAGGPSRQSMQSAESHPQRRMIAPDRSVRPVTDRQLDRSRSVVQPAMQDRKPTSELRPLQRAEPERRVYRAPPVANRAAPAGGDVRAPRSDVRQAAPQVRQVEVRRAYAGPEAYGRSPTAQRPTRSQQDYRGAPSAAPTSHQRQTRPVSTYTPQRSTRTEPQTYSQPSGGTRQLAPAYSAPQQAPRQQSAPARTERSASSTRSEAREASRKSREER